MPAEPRVQQLHATASQSCARCHSARITRVTHSLSVGVAQYACEACGLEWQIRDGDDGRVRITGAHRVTPLDDGP
jgi:uncharacterized protein (DUF983 family)